MSNPCQYDSWSQAGKHNDKRESWGHSLIIDPWGEIIGKLEDPLATGNARVKFAISSYVVK